MMNLPPTSDQEIAAWLKVVASKVEALRFGSVQIIVHEGRVTQIESTEKFRFSSGATSAEDVSGHRESSLSEGGASSS